MLTGGTRLLVDRFPLFILLYFCLQVAIRLISTPIAVIDESEQLLLSQYFALGYNAQPPLYTWVQILFCTLFGPGVLALTLLKNLLLALLYLFTFLSGTRLTGSRATAVLGTLSLLLLPQIVGAAQVDQIHSVLVTTAAAATLYCMIRLIQGGGTGWYALAGATVACGVLAKYNFVLVPLAMLAGCMVNRHCRAMLLRPQLLLTVCVAALLIAPHGFWVLHNRELATAETLQRMQLDQGASYTMNVLTGTVDLLVATIAFVGPFLAAWLLFYRSSESWRSSTATRILGGFIVAALVLITVVIIATETTQIKQRWLQPFLFVFPLLCFAAKPPNVPLRRRTILFAACCISVAIIITAIIPLRVYLVDLSSRPRRDNFPFQQLAERIAGNGFRSGTIVAEDKFIGGNMRLFFPAATVLTPSLPQQPYTLESQVLIVWQYFDPATILGPAALQTYQCQDFSENLPYLHSNRFFYQVRYRLCQATDTR